MAEKKENSGKAVFIIVIVLTVIVAGFGIFQATGSGFSIKHVTWNKTFSSKNFFSNKKNSEPKHSGSYIAELHIEGTIEHSNAAYNQKWLLDTIADLKKDDDNVGIILFLNTPGGGVYEADEVYLALQNYTSTGKPLYAYMGPLAASGGYYISCAASKIFANRNTLTGSIGVIAGSSIDLSKLMDKAGITYTTIHSGKNKNMGNYNEPLSDEQRAILQSVADECYDQFTTIVAASRHMNKEDVVKLADGRIYTAKQALGNGLIDYIDNWIDTVDHMRQAEFDGEQYEVVVYEYQQKRDIYDYLLGTLSSIKNMTASSATSLPKAVEDVITPKTPYPAYFYDGNR